MVRPLRAVQAWCIPTPLGLRQQDGGLAVLERMARGRASPAEPRSRGCVSVLCSRALGCRTSFGLFPLVSNGPGVDERAQPIAPSTVEDTTICDKSHVSASLRLALVEAPEEAVARNKRRAQGRKELFRNERGKQAVDH